VSERSSPISNNSVDLFDSFNTAQLSAAINNPIIKTDEEFDDPDEDDLEAC
jgi:hypothetical protein